MGIFKFEFKKMSLLMDNRPVGLDGAPQGEPGMNKNRI